jgi:hypothetical protein
MKSPDTMATRFTKFVRGRGERLRHAYVIGRGALNAPGHLARWRIARTARPLPQFEVPWADGYRSFAPGTFPEADEGARAAVALLARTEQALQERRKARTSKQFLVNLLTPAEVTADHPLLRLALRPDLLEAVIAYMGTVPILRSIQVFYSGVVDREPVASQLYHCDADDVRQLKIFLLCREVGRANGPLTMLDASRSERVRQATNYQYNDRLTDEAVANVLGPHQPFELVGAPGTSCLVDTSRCFHFGSRVEPGAAPRLVAMVQYLSPLAFVLPGNARRGAAFAHLASAQLRDIQRAVVTGEHRYLRHGLREATA